jgi:hypothetical protein
MMHEVYGGLLKNHHQDPAHPLSRSSFHGPTGPNTQLTLRGRGLSFTRQEPFDKGCPIGAHEADDRLGEPPGQRI